MSVSVALSVRLPQLPTIKNVRFKAVFNNVPWDSDLCIDALKTVWNLVDRETRGRSKARADVLDLFDHSGTVLIAKLTWALNSVRLNVVSGGYSLDVLRTTTGFLHGNSTNLKPITIPQLYCVMLLHVVVHRHFREHRLGEFDSSSGFRVPVTWPSAAVSLAPVPPADRDALVFAATSWACDLMNATPFTISRFLNLREVSSQAIAAAVPPVVPPTLTTAEYISSCIIDDDFDVEEDVDVGDLTSLSSLAFSSTLSTVLNARNDIAQMHVNFYEQEATSPVAASVDPDMVFAILGLGAEEDTLVPAPVPQPVVIPPVAELAPEPVPAPVSVPPVAELAELAPVVIPPVADLAPEPVPSPVGVLPAVEFAPEPVPAPVGVPPVCAGLSAFAPSRLLPLDIFHFVVDSIEPSSPKGAFVLLLPLSSRSIMFAVLT